MVASGFDSYAQLEEYFEQRVVGLAGALGKTPVVWQVGGGRWSVVIGDSR